MNKQDYRQTRELLELQIRLAQTKIAATHLKRKQTQKQQSATLPQTLAMLFDAGSLGVNAFADPAASRIPSKYRLGLAAAYAAWQLWAAQNDDAEN